MHVFNVFIKVKKNMILCFLFAN